VRTAKTSEFAIKVGQIQNDNVLDVTGLLKGDTQATVNYKKQRANKKQDSNSSNNNEVEEELQDATLVHYDTAIIEITKDLEFKKKLKMHVQALKPLTLKSMCTVQTSNVYVAPPKPENTKDGADGEFSLAM